jgi:hypothetical protein
MTSWGIARRLFAIDVLTMAFVSALAAGTIARQLGTIGAELKKH